MRTKLGTKAKLQEDKMTKKYIHFWVSVTSGLLVTIFAEQTKFYLSYVLLVPGIVLNQYLPVSGTIDIGHGALRISVLQVAFYTFLIYSSIRLLSRIRNWKHEANFFVVGI
jgi:hypothetical protein